MRKSRTTSMRLNLRLLLSGLFLFVVVCCSSLVHANSLTATSPQEETINVPLTSWNELKSNNEKALNLIEASNVPLTESQTLVMKQREELNEAHNTITKLENELQTAKVDLVKQEVTLNEMQNSLTELKGQIENDKKTIKRLKMQRNLSQMAGAGAIIGVVIHR